MLLDQRLFNQAQHTASFGADDDYNVYDKALFKGGTSHHLYQVRSSTAEQAYGTDEDLAALKAGATAKFKPSKGFSGTEGAATGGGNSREREL